MNVEDNVYVCGFARGGTTWARKTIGTMAGIDEITEPVSFTGLRDWSPATIDRVIRKSLEARGQEELLQSGRLVTKHPPNALVLRQLCETLPDAKFVFVMRDPRDVLVSYQRTGVKWTEAMKHFDLAMGRTAEFYQGYEAVAGNPRVQMLRYEDLHQQFGPTYESLREFLLGAESSRDIGGPDAEQSMSFEAETGRMHVEKAGMYRRGVIGEWPRLLSHADVSRFQESSFWCALLERHGYGWVWPTIGRLVSANRQGSLTKILARFEWPEDLSDEARHAALNRFWLLRSIAEESAVSSRVVVDARWNVRSLEQFTKSATDRGFDLGEVACWEREPGVNSSPASALMFSSVADRLEQVEPDNAPQLRVDAAGLLHQEGCSLNGQFAVVTPADGRRPSLVVDLSGPGIDTPLALASRLPRASHEEQP